MRRIVILGAALAVLGPTSSASAGGEVSLAVGPQLAGSDSVDAVTDQRALPAVSIGAAFGLAGLRPFGLEAEVGASFETVSAAGTTFRSIESELTARSLRVGGLVRRRLAPWLAAFARLDAGYTTASLGLVDASGAGRVSDRAHGVSALSGGGLELVHGAWSAGRIQLGLRGEIDYTYVSPLAFTSGGDGGGGGGGGPMIATSPASLGDLDLSGFGVRLGAFARF